MGHPVLYWYFILTVEDSPFHLQIHPVVPLDVLLLEPLLVDDLERLRGDSHMTFAVMGVG